MTTANGLSKWEAIAIEGRKAIGIIEGIANNDEASESDRIEELQSIADAIKEQIVVVRRGLIGKR
jgi:hypothetical protein